MVCTCGSLLLLSFFSVGQAFIGSNLATVPALRRHASYSHRYQSTSGDNTLTKPVPRDVTLPPRFIEKVKVPLDTPFIVSKEGEPTIEELGNENLIKIICEKTTDEETNWLVWKCLGYRYDAMLGQWNADKVFPNWSAKYPSPPDLIGESRIYLKEIDNFVMKANQALVRSVPMEHKQSLKTHMMPLGFTGFKIDELTPNRTRRAQILNFMLFYRENLFGVSLEELKRRKEERTRLQKINDPSVPQEHFAHKALYDQ